MLNVVVASGGCTWFFGMTLGVNGDLVFTTPLTDGYPITLRPFVVISFPLESVEKSPALVKSWVEPSLTRKNPSPCKATSVSAPVEFEDPVVKFVTIDATFVPEPNWIGSPDPVGPTCW